VELETLPSEPLAFVFLEPEKARDFAERVQQQKTDKAKGDAGSADGVANLSRLAKLGRSNQEIAADILGHPSLLDPRTSGVEPLATLPRGSRPLEWSKDRSKLLFAGPRFDIFQISQLNVSTGEVRTFTQGDEDHTDGSLAPDGSLVYTQLTGATGPKGGESRIFLRTAGGGEPRALTAGPGDTGPVWTADGTGIIYQTKTADGVLAIALLQPLDGAPKILTRGRDPTLSSDGQWIVYSQKLAGGFRLWRMRPDGSGKLAVGSPPSDIGQEISATVSPDGRYVAYVAEKDMRRSLRIRRLDGGGDRPLLETGDGLFPVW
jgi:Tol biopolymer transport system component